MIAPGDVGFSVSSAVCSTGTGVFTNTAGLQKLMDIIQVGDCFYLLVSLFLEVTAKASGNGQRSSDHMSKTLSISLSPECSVGLSGR